jgi:hypothetical protein
VPVRLNSGDRTFVCPELRLLIGGGHGEPRTRRSSRFETRCGCLGLLVVPLLGELNAFGPVGVLGGRGEERSRGSRARGVSTWEEVVVSKEI